ncbi:MAG: N-acetyltransferase [Mycobacteriaceae bacterium]|nr:N-acetyltransferase [Mycobacteriaceae bacterium]
MTEIRDATEGDVAAILGIHNAAIATSTAIWDTEPVDHDERLHWYRDRVAAGYPVLVAEAAGRIAGYASYAQWRSKSGYRHTMEHSVYLADGFHGRGIATLLMTELVARATKNDVHAMVAVIGSDNPASIALHDKLGFRVVGRMPEVGRKFDRWLDLTLMQLTLTAE